MRARERPIPMKCFMRRRSDGDLFGSLSRFSLSSLLVMPSFDTPRKPRLNSSSGLLVGGKYGCPDLILTNGPATATVLIFTSVILRALNIGGCHSRGKMRSVYVESALYGDKDKRKRWWRSRTMKGGVTTKRSAPSPLFTTRNADVASFGQGAGRPHLVTSDMPAGLSDELASMH